MSSVATEFKLPELAEGVTSATVTSLLVAVGDTIEAGQAVVEVETDKAAAEVPSPVGGTVTAIQAKEGATLNVGDLILVVDEAGAPAAAPKPEPEPPKQEPPPAKKAKPAEPKPKEPADKKPEVKAQSAKPLPKSSSVAAAPSVRRLARELGLDINTVEGTGPGGRVLEPDVRAAAGVGHPEEPAETEAVAVPADAGVETPDGRQAMSTIRRRTAERMTEAWTTIPHVTHFDKADISDFDKLRKRAGGQVAAAGGKLTVTAVLVKVLCAALKKYPQVNASVDMEQGEIVYKREYHIGVAVDTEHGLLVPVVRDADQLTLTQVAVELTRLAEGARTRKLTLDEMQGGTFTISNLGGIGGTGFTPIVNPPQVAILGVSRAQVEPVYTDGRFEPRTILPLALSYDHRVVDGADGARFLRFVAEALEQPLLLLLEE
jgi:pyruvate dehydrogenase E2 component (dihydrolipoyllysine-residue acetyltransferase)